jgi:hypothetical protein
MDLMGEFLGDDFHRQSTGPLTGGLTSHTVRHEEEAALWVHMQGIFVVVTKIPFDTRGTDSQLHDFDTRWQFGRGFTVVSAGLALGHRLRAFDGMSSSLDVCRKSPSPHDLSSS